MKYRILYNFLIFLGLTLAPWPVYTACIIAGIFLFDYFYESVLWVIVVEILLGPSTETVTEHYYLLGMGVAIIFSMFVKKYIRFYD